MLIYAICCLIAMTFIETIVHDRVPGNLICAIIETGLNVKDKIS